MFKVTRAIINNMNHFPYLNNVDKISAKVIDGNSKDMKDRDVILIELDKLETDIRASNLKVFLQSYIKLRKARFFYITFPAMLTAATIAVFRLPLNYDKKVEVDAYKGNHKLYNSELGEAEFDDKYYITDSSLELSENNEDDIEYTNTIQNNSLTFKMYNDVNSILAKFTIDSDGGLNFNNIRVDDIVDFNDYGNYDFTNIPDEEYEDLINRVINILKSSDILSEEQKMSLNSLLASDDKTIVADIINFTKVGQKEILVSKDSSFAKMALALLTFFYIFMELQFLRDQKPNYFSKKMDELVVNKNGKLVYGYEERIGMIYGPIKLKIKFLEAEKVRIDRIKDEIFDKTHHHPDNCPILSRYEKKLTYR